MGLSDFYNEMTEEEQVAEQEQEELMKVASYYDQLGREFFQKTAMMGDADSEYGVGDIARRAKSGFAALVKKIMGKIKAGRLKNRRMVRTRRRRK